MMELFTEVDMVILLKKSAGRGHSLSRELQVNTIVLLGRLS